MNPTMAILATLAGVFALAGWAISRRAARLEDSNELDVSRVECDYKAIRSALGFFAAAWLAFIVFLVLLVGEGVHQIIQKGVP